MTSHTSSNHPIWDVISCLVLLPGVIGFFVYIFSGKAIPRGGVGNIIAGYAFGYIKFFELIKSLFYASKKSSDTPIRQNKARDTMHVVKTNVISRVPPLCPFHRTALIKKTGRFGEFYGCRNYPYCKFTRNIS